MMQGFKNKVLRMVNALVRKKQRFIQGLGVDMVADIIKEYTKKHKYGLHNHVKVDIPSGS